MYFKSITIENVGPISLVDLQFPKLENDKPAPIVIVGENGTGKSILLSYLVNSILAGKQVFFDDVEVETGKVYKYRSPNYIKTGQCYSYSKVIYDNEITTEEWQLCNTRAGFEEQFKWTPTKNSWNKIPEKETSLFDNSFRVNDEASKKIIANQCLLYFPVNRFEEPAWLNIDNLKNRANYAALKHVSRNSNRQIICDSPMRMNTDWVLDIVADMSIYDMKLFPFHLGKDNSEPVANIFAGYHGETATIYNMLNTIVREIARCGDNVRLGIGRRHDRKISLMRDNKTWIPNLFQMSTGETQLLNLFFSIIRDYDLSDEPLKDIEDIKGIVIIDEVDAHLHTVHQKEILPNLISKFPNVQFIMTTHSPLFLLGMEETLGQDNFYVYNMPQGNTVVSSDYSEFISAYNAFKNTEIFRDEIQQALRKNTKPMIFVEGDYDIKYISKAAEYLGKEDILNQVNMVDGNGFGGLDKIWKHYNNRLSHCVPQKILLLYDCDINKPDIQKNLICKRTIPTNTSNPIGVGIENLFSESTIAKLGEANTRYIDIIPSVECRVRGQAKVIPEKQSINADEKGNICNWLCNNGSAEDFAPFTLLFSIFEDFLQA